MYSPSAEPRIDLGHQTGTPRLARAILAGFAAALAMFFLFIVAYNLARLLPATSTFASPAADAPRRWLENLAQNHLIDAGLADIYLVTAIYLAGGVLWAVVYALVEPRLARVSDRPWVCGAVFALVPGLLSVVVVLPLLGAGMFGLGLGAGPLPTIGNLLLHLAYGAILGIVYGPFGDLDASTMRRPVSAENALAASAYERTAALSLVGGLVIGALVGIVISVLDGTGSTVRLAGGSEPALVFWTALLGGTFGLLIGSFLGAGMATPGDRAA
jgi:hypothetical protein